MTTWHKKRGQTVMVEAVSVGEDEFGITYTKVPLLAVSACESNYALQDMKGGGLGLVRFERRPQFKKEDMLVEGAKYPTWFLKLPPSEWQKLESVIGG
jgi:hypothetical protein